MIDKNLLYINEQVMIDLLGDDHESILEFRADFILQESQSIIELKSMIEMDDYKAIKSKAHYLKTSSKAVGAEITSDLLEKLEISSLSGDSIECRKLIEELEKVHFILVRIIEG